MLVGIMGDTHDHLDNVRRLVERFNEAGCGLVLHAGDFVSPLAVTPLRRLQCKMLAVWGDNDANRRAIEGQMRVIGSVHEPPLETDLPDGTHLVMAHRPIERSLLDQPATQQRTAEGRETPDGLHTLAVQSHTHHPGVKRYGGLLLLNPGEACGWVTGLATAAFFDTDTGRATLFEVTSGKAIQTSRLE
jgi:hypothetical protein